MYAARLPWSSRNEVGLWVVRVLVWLQRQIGTAVLGSLQIQRVVSLVFLGIFLRLFAPGLIVMPLMILQGLRHVWPLGMSSHFVPRTWDDNVLLSLTVDDMNLLDLCFLLFLFIVKGYCKKQHKEDSIVTTTAYQ